MNRKWNRTSTLLSRRRLVLLAAILLVAACAADAARPPARQVTTAIAVGAIHAYQRHVAPTLERHGLRCRFTPSCSRYAEAELRRFGIVRGGWLAVRRVARCGPWTRAGTVDPPH